MSKFNILAVVLAIVLIGPAAAAQRGGGAVAVAAAAVMAVAAAATWRRRRRSRRWRRRPLRRWRVILAVRAQAAARISGARISVVHSAAEDISAGRAYRILQRGPVRGHRSFATHGNPGRASRGATVQRSAQHHAQPKSECGFPRKSQRQREVTHRADATLNSRSVAGALHNRTALRNPNTRAQIAAAAATAGWLHNRGANGWWRHRHGGYGWVGPLFWPFAYDDWYDYTMWGYGDDASFWDYGYNDIYAGIFAPYGYDDLAGYLPPSESALDRHRADGVPPPPADQLAQMCGHDSREIAGPADRSDPAGHSAQRRAACGAR